MINVSVLMDKAISRLSIFANLDKTKSAVSYDSLASSVRMGIKVALEEQLRK